ncbi:hypothetical protein YC2023_122367 [Brassica napus]
MLKEVTHNKSEGDLFLTSMEVMINLTFTEGSKSGFDIFTVRIHFLELFHAAFAVRIEDTPDEVINFSKTGRLFTFESQKKLWMKQQILWTAIKINEKRTVEREAPSREMWRRERTAVERAARIVAA